MTDLLSKKPMIISCQDKEKKIEKSVYALKS